MGFLFMKIFVSQRVVLTAHLVGCLVWGCTTNVWGQTDSVFPFTGSPVRGQIVDSTVNELIVKTNSGQVEVPAQSVRTLTLGEAPPQVARAIRSYEGQRFDDGLAELEKINDAPGTGFIAQYLDYLKALGMAESALGGGAVLPRDAGTAVAEFVRKHPNSYQFVPMTERLGRLYEIVGQPALAQGEYQKLAASTWPTFSLKGSFLVGKMQLAANEGTAAMRSFEAVMRSELNDAEAQSLKSVATCLNAKALAMQGKGKEAQQQLEQMIKDGNPDNQLLFANIYNALGTVHLLNGDDKSAALAFLHTDLLFAGQADAHAEALYYLATLWPKLGKTEQAYEARENLKSYYRNSIWAQKLGQ